jgi:aspartate/methionine/tyrosine aminotransferase
MAPGSAFGANGEGWIRISLANSVNHVLAGVTAIADQLDRRAEGA